MVCGMSVSGKLLWFFSPGIPASFHIYYTDSDGCNGATYSCPVCGSESHIKPHWFLGVFFLPYNNLGCLFGRPGSILSPSLVACGSEPNWLELLIEEQDKAHEGTLVY